MPLAIFPSTAITKFLFAKFSIVFEGLLTSDIGCENSLQFIAAGCYVMLAKKQMTSKLLTTMHFCLNAPKQLISVGNNALCMNASEQKIKIAVLNRQRDDILIQLGKIIIFIYALITRNRPPPIFKTQ